MKNILITGGTGLIGSALCRLLASDAQNYHIVVLSRTPNTVQDKCGQHVRGIQSLSEINEEMPIHWIINLAGEAIADRPWTQKRKAVLEVSRVDLTRNLVDWMTQRKLTPECLISGSALGWYGAGADEVLTEKSNFHDEYTHQLCDAWEQQALRAEQFGIRVCIVRTGLVLDAKGGFLNKMLLPFKLGLGGKLGSGKQFMPWIHISDMINLVLFLAQEEQAQGIFNACSPNPVRNEAFTATLAKQLHRYAFIPMPAMILKGIMGEMSRLLLTGQRAIPEKSQSLGFHFKHTDITSALRNILSDKN